MNKEEFNVDAEGNIAKSVPVVVIDRYEFMEELADQKIAFLKFKVKQLSEINNINTTISKEDARITELYKKLIPGMKQAEKDIIRKDMNALNNKLAEAFPSDFQEFIPTIVADK